MTANGLIVAFVVAVWAAYFVPLVLRRYDEASSSHSLETLSGLSRVIRRHSADDETDVATEDPTPVAESESSPSKTTPTEVSTSIAPRPTRAAARLAAQRRRRTLISLVVLLIATGALVGFGVVTRVWLLAPAALIVAWLIACRVQVRREYGITSSRSVAADTVEDSPPVRRHADDEETVVVSGQLEDVDPGRRHVMELTPLASDALDQQLAIAVPSVTASGEAVWDPLPVTVPTYVTKPRVGRTVRTIDFSGPGAWTSGHVEGEATELPAQTPREAPAEPDRRASGE